MFVVYILKTSRNTFYIGQTNNLGRRLQLHRSGKGAKSLRGITSLEVVYTETMSSRSDALKREYALKQLSHQQKEQLSTSKFKGV
jgi:putative endonuclease